MITGFITILIISLIAHLTGYSQLIILCLEFAVIGLIIAEIFRRELSFGLTILSGTLFMLLIGAVFLFFVGITKNSGPVDLILGYFKANLNKTVVFYEEMGLAPEKVTQIKELGKMINDLISRTYPSLIVIGTGFVIWMNIVISRPIFKLGRIRYPDLGRTDLWQAPDILVWGVIASGFSLFLHSTGIRFIALNCLIILAVIYVFHGLSIILFFFNKHKVPMWMRIGTYTIIIIQQIFLIVLALGGLFDQWIDFRKIHRKTK